MGQERLTQKHVQIAGERPPGSINRIAYRTMWWTVGVAVRRLFRVRVENPPDIDGAYVLVANHTSLIDPLLLGAATPAGITFMMTEIHFRSVWLGWFYRFSRAIPLGLRSARNREAMRAARAVLRRGGVLGIFPEGGLSRDGLPMLGNPGAVSLVLAEDVPVVPVHIGGAHRALPPGGGLRFCPISIRFGEPIAREQLLELGDGSRRSRLVQATRCIMDAVAQTGGMESRESWLERRRAGAGQP